MLAGFEDEILCLFRIGIWNIFADLLHREPEHFTLIRLLLAHHIVNVLSAENTLLRHFLEANRLCVGRGAVVHGHGVEQGFLIRRFQIGKLHGGVEGDFSIVYHRKQFGNQVCQADITVDLVAAVTVFFRNLFVGI